MIPQVLDIHLNLCAIPDLYTVDELRVVKNPGQESFRTPSLGRDLRF